MASILDTLLDTIGRSGFMAEHFGRAPLHISGSPDKVAGLMDLDEMSRLLSMSAVWTPASLQVVLDGKQVAAEEYCAPALSQTAAVVARPHPDKVQGWIRRGASLILNDMETLSPGPRDLASDLSDMMGGTVQGNLYFSMRQRPAFGPHFDTHEVFAVHCVGEKVWQIYEGQVDAPISHPAFQKTPEECAKEAGVVDREVEMKPGDVLYIPRGRYHDALASSKSAIHISFGVTLPKPLDVMSLIWEAAIASPSMRAYLPVKSGDAALARALENMGSELTRLLATPEVRHAAVNTMGPSFQSDSETYDVAALVSAGPVYSVDCGVSVVKQAGQELLSNGREATEIPAGLTEPVRWVMDRREITEDALAAAFPLLDRSLVADLIGKLRAMKVLA